MHGQSGRGWCGQSASVNWLAELQQVSRAPGGRASTGGHYLDKKSQHSTLRTACGGRLHLIPRHNVCLNSPRLARTWAQLGSARYYITHHGVCPLGLFLSC